MKKENIRCHIRGEPGERAGPCPGDAIRNSGRDLTGNNQYVFFLEKGD